MQPFLYLHTATLLSVANTLSTLAYYFSRRAEGPSLALLPYRDILSLL